ncbi:hypothetical protein SAPIO_CDS10495 [Scedosporium apiospermum]|uniref:P-type ATPase A domain-containing protein n=1 Tax=Pseudallescheria apiosperma TaxID=563466 RepID=A0A084FVJ5_PSEDA|nr:uncharacterized protein SAPIO_CDS10495 [Scedosporium apiospermum]KEZ39107.1 hypothetical protein SAPIO_CDS10495 [Scedosporium apiospermum]
MTYYETKALPASDLVCGDIVHLRASNNIPTDIRILSHSGDIRFDRSLLTGESEEVEGAVDVTDTSFLQSRNIALMGTTVLNRSGVGAVVLTGVKSVIGHVAHSSVNVKKEAVLIQQEIWRFVKMIVCMTIFLALLILLTWFDSIVDAIRLDRLVFQSLQKVSWSEIWLVILNVFFASRPSARPLDYSQIYAQAYLFVGFMETITAQSTFFLYMWRHAGMPVSELFSLFEHNREGFHGYTQVELDHFDATGLCVYFVTLVFLQLGNVLAMKNRRPGRPVQKEAAQPVAHTEYGK